MIRFAQGDVLEAPERYIAHGVAEGNQEGLGTGPALEISRRWPDVQRAFKKHARSGLFKGGTLWAIDPDEHRPGFCYLAAQPDMYHATLSFLRKALKALAAWAERRGPESVALPKVGAGLGKLSWGKDVKPLMAEILGPSKCLFVVYEDFVAATSKIHQRPKTP